MFLSAGFSETMGTLAKVGLFNTESQMVLKNSKRPTFRTFLRKLLELEKEDSDKASFGEKEIAQQLLILGHCSEEGTALRTAKTVVYVTFDCSM